MWEETLMWRKYYVILEIFGIFGMMFVCSDVIEHDFTTIPPVENLFLHLYSQNFILPSLENWCIANVKSMKLHVRYKTKIQD